MFQHTTNNNRVEVSQGKLIHQQQVQKQKIKRPPVGYYTVIIRTPPVGYHGSHFPIAQVEEGKFIH